MGPLGSCVSKISFNDIRLYNSTLSNHVSKASAWKPRSNQAWPEKWCFHYDDVIMDAMASHIISLTIVYSTVYSSADERKHQSSASLAFVRGIHRGPVNTPHKWPVTRKMFSFDDVIMFCVLCQIMRHWKRTVVMLTIHVIGCIGGVANGENVKMTPFRFSGVDLEGNIRRYQMANVFFQWVRSCPYNMSYPSKSIHLLQSNMYSNQRSNETYYLSMTSRNSSKNASAIL